MPSMARTICPHDLRSFRIAEVEVVGDRDRIGPHGRQVSPGFRHGLLAALIGVRGDIAWRAVTGQRQSLAGSMDPDNARIGARRRVLEGVGHHMAIVLLPYPPFGGAVGTRDERPGWRRPNRSGRGRPAASIAGPRRRVDPGTIVVGRVLGQGRERQVADNLAMTPEDDSAGVGGQARWWRRRGPTCRRFCVPSASRPGLRIASIRSWLSDSIIS